MGPMAGGQIKSESDILFEGQFDFAIDSDGDWEAAFYESGSIRFKKSPGDVDIAIVAGGESGKQGRAATPYFTGLGGEGGKGGEVVTAQRHLQRGVSYTAVVGGSDENSTLSLPSETITARSGYGANGGIPSSTRGTPPTEGSDGTKIWGGESLIAALADIQYGAGGGPGEYESSDYASYPGAAGGTTGAGRGGYLNAAQAASGQANTGSAGGGAFRDDAHDTDGTVGLGGSGIVRMRNHRGA